MVPVFTMIKARHKYCVWYCCNDISCTLQHNWLPKYDYKERYHVQASGMAIQVNEAYADKVKACNILHMNHCILRRSWSNIVSSFRITGTFKSWNVCRRFLWLFQKSRNQTICVLQGRTEPVLYHWSGWSLRGSVPFCDLIACSKRSPVKPPIGHMQLTG